MNEEELFCKLFPEYVVNGKPLSPYFDLFESGYEQAEKRIEELEKENAETKERIKTLEYRCENIKDTDTMELVALQRENAELKDYRLTTLAKQQTDMSKYALNLEHKLSWYDDQLTKAKELLKWWVNHCGYHDLHYAKKTEQFLNSEVEK